MELCTIPGHFSISLFRELIPQRRKVTHHKKKSLELCMCWVRELCFLQTHTHTHICIQYTTVEVVGDGKVRRRFTITFFWGRSCLNGSSFGNGVELSSYKNLIHARVHTFIYYFFFERIFFLFHLVAFCSISVTRSLAALSTNNRWFVFSPFFFLFRFFSSLHILCVGRVTLVCEK